MLTFTTCGYKNVHHRCSDVHCNFFSPLAWYLPLTGMLRLHLHPSMPAVHGLIPTPSEYLAHWTGLSRLLQRTFVVSLSGFLPWSQTHTHAHVQDICRFKTKPDTDVLIWALCQNCYRRGRNVQTPACLHGSMWVGGYNTLLEVPDR